MRPLLFLWLLVVTISGYAEDPMIGTIRNPYTNEDLDFSISAEQLKKLPQWDGLTTPVPLSETEAIVAAQNQAKKDQKNNIGEIGRACIVNRPLSGGFSVWAYSINFKPHENEHMEGVTYVVLLDGSVISPSPRK